MRADTRLMASLAQQREAEAETLGCCKATVLLGINAGTYSVSKVHTSPPTPDRCPQRRVETVGMPPK